MQTSSEQTAHGASPFLQSPACIVGCSPFTGFYTISELRKHHAQFWRSELAIGITETASILKQKFLKNEAVIFDQSTDHTQYSI